MRGVVGMEARPFGSLHRALNPVLMRGEVDFNGSSLAAMLKMIYHFGGVDP